MTCSRRALLLGSLAAPALAKPEVRPSILLILAEDVGAWMLGCYGNPEIRTPNIDKLAQLGTRFTFAFSASAAGSPGRAALLTGRFPAQTGITDFLTPEPIENPPQGQAAAPESFRNEVMISDVLAKQGYSCGFVGHWGLGTDAQAQHQFGFWCTTAPGTLQRQNPTLNRNGRQATEKGDLNELLTANACQFIEQQTKEKPFFLTVAYPVGCRPYEGLAQRYYDLYAQAQFDRIGREPAAANALRDADLLRDTVGHLRKAAAALTAFDDQIVMLRSKLSERGLAENTLIILTSDNGSLLGRHGLWSDGHASDPINMFDEVVRVPLIWSWFGPIPPEGVRPELVSACDLLPAICEAAGAPVPDNRNLSGRSYLPLVTNRPLPKKQPWSGVVFAQLRDTEMVRDNRYKLVLRGHGKAAGALFDLRSDAREKANQYDNEQYVTIRDRLAAELSSWRKKYSS